jgi:dihydroneopterin aldolase
MTLFLASVSNPGEAELALAGGADILDLKDANRGALGALAPDLARSAVQRIAGRRPVSAVLGDLPMDPAVLREAAAGMAGIGVEFVKAGLFPNERRAECIRALQPLSQEIKLVGVMFADLGLDLAVVPALADAGFAGAMLDTARKGGGRLLDHADFPALRDFIAACRRRGLLAGLAGALETPDIPRLLPLQPDVLGFRSALCVRQERTAEMDPAAVALVRELIPRDERGGGADQSEIAVDYRLLAARGYSLDPAKDRPTDQVFVRDFVLPVRLGAYAREHAAPQRVRFDVDVEVLRPPRKAEDMRDVFSYDIVTDGIRMIVAGGHIALAETLAERIAALILEHARVVRVKVRVEKLELAPAVVGVELTRERAAEMASVHQLYRAALRDPDAAE